MNEDLSALIQPQTNKKIEFRLYYDDLGNPISYSADGTVLPHKYIIVDPMTYAECRFDIKVIDEKIVKDVYKKIVTTYVKSIDDSGVRCSLDDISVLVEDTLPNNKWKIVVNEY